MPQKLTQKSDLSQLIQGKTRKWTTVYIFHIRTGTNRHVKTAFCVYSGYLLCDLKISLISVIYLWKKSKPLKRQTLFSALKSCLNKKSLTGWKQCSLFKPNVVGLFLSYLLKSFNSKLKGFHQCFKRLDDLKRLQLIFALLSGLSLQPDFLPTKSSLLRSGRRCKHYW